MATTKLFLDCRRKKEGAEAPIMIALRNANTSAFIHTGIRIYPNQWDNKSGCVINHPQRKAINTRLAYLKGEVDVAILNVATNTSIIKMKASELKRRINAIINPDSIEESPITFMSHFKTFADSKIGHTKELYYTTMARIRAFEQNNSDNLLFEHINYSWLMRFDKFLALTAPSANARSIHMRNIRAVFNDAINNDITDCYPFRKFKIKSEETRKRNFDIETLRAIFNFTCEDKYLEKYRDLFKLQFMLIGINFKDLCYLKEMKNGRIEYVRAKTKKRYSIKVEPEMLEIMEKYRGKKYLLEYLDTNNDYISFYNTNRNNLIKLKQRINVSGQVHIDTLTTYWTRHTWATIAAELDIPDAIISQALGHSATNHTTAIYIERNIKKVDDANRKVLDWVLYGKR